MSDPLATYLHDHLAGARSAVMLLEFLRDEHGAEPMGRFAQALLAEVEEDRVTLEQLAERVGAGTSTLKEAFSAVGERVTQIKLQRRSHGPFGTFEALELLALGILGKGSLWRALGALAQQGDARLGGLDFARLIARAEAQHRQVEERRLATVPAAMRPTED